MTDYEWLKIKDKILTLAKEVTYNPQNGIAKELTVEWGNLSSKAPVLLRKVVCV